MFNIIEESRKLAEMKEEVVKYDMIIASSTEELFKSVGKERILDFLIDDSTFDEHIRQKHALLSAYIGTREKLVADIRQIETEIEKYNQENTTIRVEHNQIEEFDVDLGDFLPTRYEITVYISTKDYKKLEFEIESFDGLYRLLSTLIDRHQISTKSKIQYVEYDEYNRNLVNTVYTVAEFFDSEY